MTFFKKAIIYCTI